MKVSVLAFSRIRDLLGAGQLEITVAENSTIAGLVALLEGETPGLADWRGKLLLARNGEWADADTPMEEGDEIALMPPVQGG